MNPAEEPFAMLSGKWVVQLPQNGIPLALTHGHIGRVGVVLGGGFRIALTVFVGGVGVQIVGVGLVGLGVSV